ncbi:hypothetical protein HA052_21540 [Chromobacterium haemolyticum]|uniref:Ribbon-helix-helix protein CopG domain-containing protein n=1 Tax=Chromobacterium fluminis TaxID=3044269 RepID=A0ABX0L7I6_9NEIS|nr:hypothetical protein [Chromobacterium haemolyticum]NHR07777.1 hypothetical protein [Chromobacterium haemolyticum]
MAMVRKTIWIDSDTVELVKKIAEKQRVRESIVYRSLITDSLRQHDVRFDLIFDRLNDISELIKHGNVMSASALVASAMTDAGLKTGDGDNDAFKSHVKAVIRTAIRTGEAVDKQHSDGTLVQS